MSAAGGHPALHPAAALAALADETRLRAFAAVALGATTPEEVAATTGLGVRDARRALDRLVAGGVTRRRGEGVEVALDRLREAARAASTMRPTVQPEEIGASAEQVAVLRNFLVDGRLVSIPVAKAKRRVVLDFLAQRFEPGRVYPEREVNLLLGAWHADYAALRRYLVDEEFLERRGGFYWRAGGTFDLG